MQSTDLLFKFLTFDNDLNIDLVVINQEPLTISPNSTSFFQFITQSAVNFTIYI
jgi:hypothetical protein